jgi:hypothetical protein
MQFAGMAAMHHCMRASHASRRGPLSRFERLYQPFLRGNMRTPAGDDEDSNDLAYHLPR